MMSLIDGVQDDKLAVADRGLHYGDGLFETFAVTAGIPELWDRHMQRLGRGCKRLDIPMPDGDLLRAEAARVCTAAKRAVLKLILTRGSGGRGYRPPNDPRPSRILSLHPWPDYPEQWLYEGIAIRVCRHRLSINPTLAGLKHLNRLDQVLARSEWNDPVIAEGIMLDVDNWVIEGTMTNLFLVRAGRLFTPNLAQAGIAGVMRGLIMEAAASLGIPCERASLTLADLICADELLLCNSLIGVWPVRRLEAKSYSVPGPVTIRLSAVINEVRRA